jgi:hypothetical protein
MNFQYWYGNSLIKVAHGILMAIYVRPITQ